MTYETKTIKCAACKLPLESGAEANGEVVYSCPSCGNGDTLENVQAEAAEYVRDFEVNKLNEQLEGLARSSSFMKLDKKFTVRTDHRFIVDL